MDNPITKVTDIPYFEGDFWTNTIEDLIKELDTEDEDRRKIEEYEILKLNDDAYIDDSIEIEEPTEVKISGTPTWENGIGQLMVLKCANCHLLMFLKPLIISVSAKYLFM